MNNRLIGKLPGGSSVVEVAHDRAIQHVDELIYPPGTDVFVSPGFIDLQVNGFAGVDYNDPASSRESISASIRTMFTTGVTRFFATVITGSRERMLGALKNLAAAKEEFRRSGLPEADAMEAFHVEGPHISPEDGPRGAHPVEHVRPPDIEEFKRWQEVSDGNVRLVTVAPEWLESPAYIRVVTGSGVTVSIGHTRANSDQIQAAVDAGATMSTHLGNGANSTLPKTANYIWDQLAEDRLTASFVVDGIHIPSSFLKSALRAKGVERSVLVTDAVMPAMCAPGPYQLGQVEVELRTDQSVVLRGGTRLAGSALRMDHAIGNCVRLGRISLREALAMATVNAARVGRIPGRRGLTPGERADLVLFEWDEASLILAIRQTVVAGQTVYATLGDTTGTAVHP
ncbi:MAG TPA: amidohydrolase family protein [Bryobacteraceae bacterium]|nr:amidohydrolase family protein [Bryobacteraceae bacterium]